MCIMGQIGRIHSWTRTACLMHGHRKLRLTEGFDILRLMPDFEIFQNLPPDAIFCDHAPDMYHEWHSVQSSFVKWFY